MKIQEYVDLIKEINKKNGVEWDVTTSTLAIYKLLKSPAVANYYNNLELRRDDNGALIICECDKFSKVNAKSVGRFVYDVIDTDSLSVISYQMNLTGSKPKENVRPSTNGLRVEMLKIRERFLNSNSFAEFIDGFDLNNPDRFNKELIADSKLDFKVKKLIKFAGFCDTVKNDPNYDDNHAKIEMLMSIVDDTYKVSNHRSQSLVQPILNIMEKKDDMNNHTVFYDLYKLASYDKLITDSYYFDIREDSEKIIYYKKIAQMPEVKENTLFGVVMNNPNDIINKIADTFMFNDLKSLALMQTRLAIKAPTLEEMLESRPIVDEIYQEAVRRQPNLEQSMSDRFEHVTIKDSEFDLGGESKMSFSTLMDNLQLYGESNKHYYLTIQPEILAYPMGVNYIMNDQPYERRYGHDGIGPYYVSFSVERSITSEVNALYVEKIFVAKSLEENYIKEMFENLFQECMVRKIALVMEEPNFHNVIGARNMKIFNDIKDKYTGIVPCITCNTEMSQLKSLLKSDLTYKEILSVQEKFKSLASENGSNYLTPSECFDQTDKVQNERIIDRKNHNKI